MPLTAASPHVYYEDHGSGEPLLAIAGFGSSSAVFQPLVEASSDAFRWITYDHPAAGRSSWRAFACTTGAMARSAIDVLDELGLDAAHIAGASLGGAVALELALRFPERARSLILLGTTAAGPLHRGTLSAPTLAATLEIMVGSTRRRRLWLGPAMFSDGFREREPERARALAVLLNAYPPALWGVVGQCIAASLHDVADELDQIGVPTLVLHGERDVPVPLRNAEQLASGIPDAELHVFPGRGHAFALESPAETIALVEDWLGRRGFGAVPTP
jgi:pimeloyl-ACP methyl ester carboxylesterase